MPLKDAACKHCMKIEEVLLKMDELCPPCKVCGGERKFLISMPAKTSGRWGDNTGKYGVNGCFDRGLGATYYNSMEREAICKAKGLIPLSDVGGDKFVEKRLSEQAQLKNDQDRILQAYNDKTSYYGGGVQGKIRAIEEVFPASDCLHETGAVNTISKE